MHSWFTKHPEVINIFPTYKGFAIDQIKALKMEHLKTLGTIIFSAIASIIQALSDDAKLTQLLEQNKKLFIQYKPNISAFSFNVFFCY